MSFSDSGRFCTVQVLDRTKSKMLIRTQYFTTPGIRIRGRSQPAEDLKRYFLSSKRIRHRRISMRLSQKELGSHLGVSFQQIQKYEKFFKPTPHITLVNTSLLTIRLLMKQNIPYGLQIITLQTDSPS